MKIRNIVITISLLIAGCLYSFGQRKTFTVTSKIADLKDSTYNMTIWNGISDVVFKKGSTKNGQIYYQDTTSVPLIIRLTLPTESLYKRVDRGYIPVKSQSIWFVAMPGGKILLKGKLSDFAEVYPSGDKENDVISKLNKGYHPLLNKSANIELKLAKDTVEEALKKRLEAEQERIDSEAEKYLKDFLKKNISSIAGLYYLEDMLIREIVTIDTVEALLPTVAKAYQSSPFYTILKNRVAGSKYDVGKSIFQINTRNTYDGKVFDSNSWKGKFYLIDFWGSWCGPCMADVPDLKKLRDSYPDQLRVLGIASDKNDSWRKAIEQHNLNWAHILNDKGSNNYVLRLNVTGFPTKILVDPNGTIVYRSTGGGETSFEKISEIIKNWK